jgi:hypothetical protein
MARSRTSPISSDNTEDSISPNALIKSMAAKPAPVNFVAETKEDNSVPSAIEPEVIQTDVKAKLSRKTDRDDLFVPSNPVALEKAADQVAKDEGFELNRGTSIGARLMARSRKLA